MLDKPKKRFTDEERQQIINDHAAQQDDLMWHHDRFWEEVRAIGPSHPAGPWFQWDKEAGWNEANLERARRFGQGLRVQIIAGEVVTYHGKVEIFDMPATVATLEQRKRGGGSILASSDPAYFRGNADVAAMELKSWLRTQRSTCDYFHIDLAPLEEIMAALQKAVGD